ncbi:MAG TPA: hypothetical protein VHP38_00345 [Ruminiclostridium sp.]|nr:hypothetical protein [Ruminiclostridium sp.]
MKQSDKFDERQLMERGKIFMQAFLLLALLVFIDSFVKTLGLIWTDYFGSSLITIMSVTCFASIKLILKDSYKGKNVGSWNAVVILITVVSILNILKSALDLITGGDSFVKNSQLSSGGALAISNLFLLLIAIVYWLKTHMDKKAEKLMD